MQSSQSCEDSTEPRAKDRTLTDVLTSVLTSRDFNLSTKRCREIQEKGKRILSTLLLHDALVSVFMKSLKEAFNAIFKEASRASTHSEKLARCWSRFHSSRITTLPKLWVDLLDQCGLDSVKHNDRLVCQSLLQALFESEMKAFTATCTTPTAPILTSQTVSEITEDEKNIIMYASGFVPVSLIRKYEKMSNHKSASFVQCLLNMAVGAYEEDFYDYARRWYELHNRGGASEVNDGAFSFFLQLEKLIRVELVTLRPHSHTSSKEDIIDRICTNESIDFHWSVLAIDLSAEDSTELLSEVVKLWLTVRGHSISGTWLEQYKRVAGTQSKQKSSLRKELKRVSTDEHEH